jgi:4-hydroxybutyrate CoA-transferase
MSDARIGVKYCGGCNAGYDRRAAYESRRDGVRAGAAAEYGVEVSFEQAEGGVLYDALLVICGCANRCASISEYESRTKPVCVWNEDGISAAMAGLLEPMKGMAIDGRQEKSRVFTGGKL